MTRTWARVRAVQAEQRRRPIRQDRAAHLTHFLGEQRKIRYNTMGRGSLRFAYRAWFDSDEAVIEVMGVEV